MLFFNTKLSRNFYPDLQNILSTIILYHKEGYQPFWNDPESPGIEFIEDNLLELRESISLSVELSGNLVNLFNLINKTQIVTKFKIKI